MELLDIWEMLNAGHTSEALTELDLSGPDGYGTEKETSRLLLRGWALYTLRRKEEAHQDLSRAVTVARTDSDLGRALLERGSFLMKDRRFGEAQTSLLEALPRLTSRPDLLLMCRYNLGWGFLSRLDLPLAHVQFQAGLRLTRGQPETRLFRTLLHSGLSVYARLSGDARWSAAVARMALSEARSAEQFAQAHRSLGMALWRSSEIGLAQREFQCGVDVATGAVQASLRFNSACLEGLPCAQTALQDHLDQVLPQDQPRVLLHAAEAARIREDLVECRRLVEAALVLDEPYPVVDEAWVLPELFQLAREWHLSVPTSPVLAGHALHLQVLDEPRLHVNGHPPGLALGNDSAAVLAFLIVYGSSSLTELAENATEDQRESTVRRAIRDLRWVLADAGVIVLRGGEVRLSTEWTWSCDLQSQLQLQRLDRPLLPGSYAPWIMELQEQLA